MGESEEGLEECLRTKGRPELDHHADHMVGGIPVAVWCSRQDGHGLPAGNSQQSSSDPKADGSGQDLEMRRLQRMEMLSTDKAPGLEARLETQDLTAGLPGGPQKTDPLAVFGIVDDLS